MNNQTGGAILGASAGVVFSGGGTVTNTGKINGGALGVHVAGGVGAVTNSGAISGSSQGGIDFGAGGTIANQSGGTISGASFGLYMLGGSTSKNIVTNSGSISAMSGAGVNLGSGGVVNNQTGGTINGASAGVYVNGNAGAVTNAGTIGGGVASIVFAGSGANSLTLGTGSTLNGGASGSKASGATNALILQGHGTASNSFANFNTLTSAATGTWTLGGTSSFGDTTISTGILAVTGSLTSKTLEIGASAQLTDAGSVSVSGSVTNSGNLTINGVTMRVATAGGTFTELAGGTTTLLNGGVLDPPNVVINGGAFRGSGSIEGNVTMTGGSLEAGGEPGGSLKLRGDYSQTAGKIVFEVDPNGAGGFLETALIFEPSGTVDISNTTLVFDFLNGADPNQFIADDLLNLNTFFRLSDGGLFCSELNCAAALEDINYADNVRGLTITGFDPTTGGISVQSPSFVHALFGAAPQATPEPGEWALLTTGMLAIGGLKIYRRRKSEGLAA